jgi:hypothetical protein
MEPRTKGILYIVLIVVLMILSFLCVFSPVLYKIQELFGIPG